MFRLQNNVDACRGCGRVKEDTHNFRIEHHEKCRHMRMFSAMKFLYTVPDGLSLFLVDESIADIVCAILGPCGAFYTWEGVTVSCRLAPGHDHIGRAATLNHMGWSDKHGEIIWAPNATGLEEG